MPALDGFAQFTASLIELRVSHHQPHGELAHGTQTGQRCPAIRSIDEQILVSQPNAQVYPQTRHGDVAAEPGERAVGVIWSAGEPGETIEQKQAHAFAPAALVEKLGSAVKAWRSCPHALDVV